MLRRGCVERRSNPLPGASESISGGAEHNLHELFVIYLDPSIPVGVRGLECFRQSLNHHTSPHKAIESNPRCWSISHRSRPRRIFLFDQSQYHRGELVSEAAEGGSQFMSVDRTGMISVEMSENVLPIFDVSPKPLEFIETNGSAPIGIENVHEHLDSIKIELCPVSINQCRLQLSNRDRS